VNTGTDYKAILQSLLDYGNWLAAHRPEPALAGNITAPRSQLQGAYRHDLTILRDQHKREYEVRSGPNAITVVSSKPDLFTARVVEQITATRVVDSTGRTTSQAVKPAATTTYNYVVASTGNRWRLVSGKAESDS
jgi:hypothetical protein